MPAYRMDVYYRPEGSPLPVLASTHMIIASDDTAAVLKAQSLFLSGETAAATGFILSALGIRRSDDRVVYNHLEKNGDLAPAAARPPAPGEAAAKPAAGDPDGTTAPGQRVTEIPACIGFDC